MLMNFFINNLKNQIVNHDKIKKRKLKRKKEKLEQKKFITKQFGKTRYTLSYLFGEWVLYSCNNSFYTKEKAADCSQQPSSNVIYLSDYKIAK
jgi:hypothetical protein